VYKFFNKYGVIDHKNQEYLEALKAIYEALKKEIVCLDQCDPVEAQAIHSNLLAELDGNFSAYLLRRALFMRKANREEERKENES